MDRRMVSAPRLLLAGLTAVLPLADAPCAHGAAGISKGPYLQRPTTTGIIVRWVTDTKSAGKVAFAAGESGPVASESTVSESAPAQYHRVQLSGLKPHTRYHYRVTCSGETREGTFITAATPRQPFKFIAYGDTRTNADAHAAVLARMAQFHPEFVLQSGDLVQDGTNEAQWTVFFHTAETLMRNVPYFPALGNHERNGAPYFRYFDAPRDYSFDYGNTHFVVLDSNRPEPEFAAQERWLREDLAANQRAVWRIVTFHHTPYTCVAMPSRRAVSVLLRRRLEPLFEAGRVQLVINGHDHTYQHHVAPDGIHYVVSGGGGAPLYPVKLDTPFTRVAKSAYHDCEITVNGAQLSLRAVEPDGAVIDQFTLHADRHGATGRSQK